jgi:hypothetical protein
MRGLALVCCAALITGCFGYNSSAKKWSYVGDTVLILGGGAAIASDVTSDEAMCTGTGCSDFDPPFGGTAVAGALLVSAGIVGIVLNATRPDVKTSR